MKQFLLATTLLTGLVLSGSVNAQDAAGTPPDPNAPIMKFAKDTIDYGTIAYAADGYRYFDFTNVGKEPLIIKEAHGSCGCTVPTPPKEPIQPGQSAQIKVHYDTQRPGHFIKSVTVTSNANPGSKVVYITGNIMPNPNTATPNNPAPAQQPPATVTAPPPAAPPGIFPMKLGDNNEYVKNLQMALMKMYGDPVLKKYGADAKFGAVTISAVKKAGYSVPVTEADYNDMLKGNKKERAAKGMKTGGKKMDAATAKSAPSGK